MFHLSDLINQWDERFFLDRNGEMNLKAYLITFASIFWIPISIYLSIMMILQGEAEGADILYYIKGVGVILFLFLIILVVCFPLFCIYGLIFGVLLKIKSPIKGIALFFMTLISCFILYSLYRAYWPVGDYQILREDFRLGERGGFVTIIHKKKCHYYHGFYQDKEDFKEYVKFKNHKYCTCLSRAETKILDAYTEENMYRFDESDGADSTHRGYDVYYCYDLYTKDYEILDVKKFKQEYYNKD